jgi:hypothetical protein
MATALALLEAAVEQFAALDVEALSDDELHETIRRLSVVSTRLEADRAGRAPLGRHVGVE